MAQLFFLRRLRALVVVAHAELLGVAEVAARARVHTRNEHERGRVLGGVACSADADDAVLERLSHHFQYRPWELWQFVEEEHAVVRQRNLAWRGIGAASYKGNSATIRFCWSILFKQKVALQTDNQRINDWIHIGHLLYHSMFGNCINLLYPISMTIAFRPMRGLPGRMG